MVVRSLRPVARPALTRTSPPQPCSVEVRGGKPPRPPRAPAVSTAPDTSAVELIPVSTVTGCDTVACSSLSTRSGNAKDIIERFHHAPSPAEHGSVRHAARRHPDHTAGSGQRDTPTLESGTHRGEPATAYRADADRFGPGKPDGHATRTGPPSRSCDCSARRQGSPAAKADHRSGGAGTAQRGTRQGEGGEGGEAGGGEGGCGIDSPGWLRARRPAQRRVGGGAS